MSTTKKILIGLAWACMCVGVYAQNAIQYPPVQVCTAVTNQFISAVSNAGVCTFLQPAASNLSNGTTGSGTVVLNTSPALVTPILGTPTSVTLTNADGTAASLTAGHVTTNANLTGVITSVGNATSIAAQTGTGSTFVMQTAPSVTNLVVNGSAGNATSTSGTGYLGTSATNGMNLGGQGSTRDVGLTDRNGAFQLDLTTTGVRVLNLLNVASDYQNNGVLVISHTAPTYASGGCSTHSAVVANGTAAFQIQMTGTCTGSQPIVFTLPAAANSWQCHARDITTPADIQQTGAASTTSVTITNYSLTSGLTQAWTTNDFVAVSCFPY